VTSLRVLRGLCASCNLAVLIFLLSGIANSQVALSTSTLNFGSVPVGSTTLLQVKVSNTTKGNLNIVQAAVSGAEFSFAGPNLPITLASTQTVSLYVAFAPTIGGSASGTLTFTTGAAIGNSGKLRSSSTSVVLAGTGATPGQLTPSPSGLSFGTVPVGGSQTQHVMLTNSGGSNLTISQDTITGTGFSVTGLTLPVTLAPGQGVAASVTFAPTAGGSTSGVLTVASNASDPSLGIALSGSGSTTGQLSLSPAAMNFGSVTIGTTQMQSGMLTAMGSSVTISSASSSNSEFILSGFTLPVTIAAGQSLPFTVVFAPKVTGTASTNISFSSNASVSPTAETASGTGATIQHVVDLSWNASTSSPAGYNIYRGSASGGPYTKINSSLDASTYYSDGAVVSGQTYFYVTTAVDTNGAESGYSNQVQVQVPMP
jgi:hypothetical protein